MGFLDIGAGELLLVLIVALIIVGPRKLVDTARSLGKMSRALRKATQDFTASITREADSEDKEPSRRPPDRS